MVKKLVTRFYREWLANDDFPGPHLERQLSNESRWWLNAIADEIENCSPCSIVSPLLAAKWLRTQAEE